MVKILPRICDAVQSGNVLQGLPAVQGGCNMQVPSEHQDTAIVTFATWSTVASEGIGYAIAAVCGTIFSGL